MSNHFNQHISNEIQFFQEKEKHLLSCMEHAGQTTYLYLETQLQWVRETLNFLHVWGNIPQAVASNSINNTLSAGYDKMPMSGKSY